MTKIYHNPRCRKSREALHILRETGHEPEIIEYLVNPPSEEELTDLLKKMNLSPKEIIRKGEDIFKSEFKGKEYTDVEWVRILVDHPKLIERPIVVHREKAILGRPPERVLEIIH